MPKDGSDVNGTASATLHPSVFSIPAIWCNPANLGTADCGQICRAEDGCDYVIKDGFSGDSHPLVPHCEWFCSELGELLQIACPPHKVVQMGDATFVFGSRWLAGALPTNEVGNWVDRVKNGDIALSEIASTLSHVYALDHFVYNEDRHHGNFMVHAQHGGYAVLSMDYSRAWVKHGFPLPPIPMHDCNTIKTRRGISDFLQVQYIDASEVDKTLEKIRNIPVARIERILSDQPAEWLPEAMREAILSWWGSPDMLSRVDAISAGVKNGTCL